MKGKRAGLVQTSSPTNLRFLMFYLVKVNLRVNYKIQVRSRNCELDLSLGDHKIESQPSQNVKCL
jgi:hypothetical protein